jgi:anaerobic magnesium-protoporphyrin IX monomethyl ester cyclase
MGGIAMSTDCLVIGFNEEDFAGYVEMVKSMGASSGAYQDLSLAFVEYEGKPMRSMDLLNLFHFEGRPGGRPFSNVDFMWPVVLYLSTFLHRRGFTYDYVNLFHLEKERLREKLEREEILTVAITTTLYVSPSPILEIVSFIRRYNDRVKIVVGGPYVSNQAKTADLEPVQRLYKYLGADVYVDCQEGEQALVNLLTAIKSGRSLDEVDNISYRSGDTYVITRRSTESNALEENMVDYSLFSREELGPMVSLRTAKSCPFSCAFCGFPQRAGQYTYMSVEMVEKELNALRDLGVTTLTFLDDTFNVPKRRFRELLQMMIRNEYGFKWNSFYRSDHGDEETIRLMGESGCEGVFLGVESGSDTMLKLMNKTSRRANYLTAIPLLRQAGISTYASLIVGFPGETHETVRETLDLLEEARPTFYRTQLWYADPATPIWNRRHEVGLKGSAFNWEHHSMDTATACDLIEKAFLYVQSSIWLPQAGFEQWSTFYLQRRGMPLDRVCAFLKCFNALVRERLLNPSLTAHDPRLIEALRLSCRFDEPAEPDLGAVEELSGARYQAAQELWIGGLSEGPPESALQNLLVAEPGVEAADEAWKMLAVPGHLGREPFPEVLLAAIGALMLRLSARQEMTVVTCLDDGEIFPVTLHPRWDIGFQEFTRQTGAVLARAAENPRYGLHLLTNPRRLAEFGRSCPVLDVGFVRSAGPVPATPLAGLERAHPEIRAGLRLVFGLAGDAEDPRVFVGYRPGVLRPEAPGLLAAHLAEILEQASRQPGVLLEALSLGGAAVPAHPSKSAVESHASAAFDF